MKLPKRTILLACVFASSLAVADGATADDMHPAMTSKYSVGIGGYFSARDFNASVEGSALTTIGGYQQVTNFESALGEDDSPELLIGSFRWEFGEKWGVAIQHFSSKRSGRKTLEESIPWEDVIYEVGVDVSAGTEVSITRLAFSRDFWETGRHSLRLTGGLHWLDASIEISGEATVDDQSGSFFLARKASASFPVPNVGAWYRYSPSKRWLLGARVDWFSANVGDFSGGIWNAALSADFALTEHISAGLSYQFFEIDGTVNESTWKGQMETTFDGPILQLSGHW